MTTYGTAEPNKNQKSRLPPRKRRNFIRNKIASIPRPPEHIPLGVIDSLKPLLDSAAGIIYVVAMRKRGLDPFAMLSIIEALIPDNFPGVPDKVDAEFVSAEEPVN